MSESIEQSDLYVHNDNIKLSVFGERLLELMLALTGKEVYSGHRFERFGDSSLIVCWKYADGNL